ncbi:MAG: hypothetical protein ACOX56_02230 [Acholeplasmataceae bacterium]|jgi:predicted deacylase
MIKRLFGILLLLLCLVGCNNKQEEKVKIKKFSILKDTIYETDVYHFITNKPGSKVVIIGGIHGDEVAGYSAAERLLEENPFAGEVLLIPRANILATQLNERYPGAQTKGVYKGVTYSDLNRCLPGNANGTITEKIAHELVTVIKDFEPTYIIDLHESLRSYKDSRPKIGDSLIYSNKESAWIALQMLEHFNETYLEPGDVVFRLDSNAPKGSFNNYFGSLGYMTFTIETNRQLRLEKRITQQLDLIKTFFYIIQ